MKYLLTKESLEKLAIEVFGQDRVWVKQKIEEREINNPDFSQDDYDEDPDGYDESEFILQEIPIISIYIHFPSLIIKNSKGHEHPILDLFVCFEVTEIYPDRDYKCNVGFLGKRTTFSIKEMYSGYTHSHLSSGYSFNYFCTGSSYYNSLLMDIRMNPTEEMWLMLLMGLENFVSWESLEGGPYRRIDEITFPAQSVDASSLRKELKRMLPLLPKQVWSYLSGIQLIENHPLLYQCFNEHSSIRRTHGLNDSEAKTMIQDWESQYKNKSLIWKEGTENSKLFPFRVVHEFSETSPQIDREVVNQYIQILKQQTAEYNQNLSYEHAKQEWISKTTGKTRITQ